MNNELEFGLDGGSQKTIYEWKVEMNNDHGDIENIFFFDNAAEAVKFAMADMPNGYNDFRGINQVVLVRDTWASDGVLIERMHAYESEEPQMKSNGYLQPLTYHEEPTRAVPKKYVAEFNKAKINCIWNW